MTSCIKSNYLLYKIGHLSPRVGLLTKLSLNWLLENTIPHEQVIPELVKDVRESLYHTLQQEKPILVLSNTPELNKLNNLSLSKSQSLLSFQESKREPHEVFTMNAVDFEKHYYECMRALEKGDNLLADGHHRLQALKQMQGRVPDVDFSLLVAFFHSKTFSLLSTVYPLSHLSKSLPMIYLRKFFSVVFANGTEHIPRAPFLLRHNRKMYWLEPRSSCELFDCDKYLQKTLGFSRIVQHERKRITNWHDFFNPEITNDEICYIAPTFQQVLAQSKSKKLFPPHWTYFSPRLQSGVLTHNLESSEITPIRNI